MLLEILNPVIHFGIELSSFFISRYICKIHSQRTSVRCLNKISNLKLKSLMGSTSTKIVLITMVWESIKINFKISFFSGNIRALVVINISCLHDGILGDSFS